MITRIVEEGLEYGNDGLPKPIYCNPATHNPPGKTSDPRCGWGDNTANQGVYNLVSTSGKDMFDVWYRDNPVYNMRSGGSQALDPVAGSPGFYSYSSPTFTPAGAGWHPLGKLTPCTQSNYGLDCSNGGKHFPLQVMDSDGSPYSEITNNFTFSFTTEIHTFFTYTGQNQSFEFSGDDDLWVYINDILAVDVGGLHPASTSMINLDNAYVRDYLGLQVGGIYSFDLYNAERHTTGSNFKVTTSLTFECSILNSGGSVYSWAPATLAQDFKLVGGKLSSVVVGDTIRLTSASAPNLASYAFLRQQVNIGTGFVLSFQFKVLQPGRGAGFVFALLSQSITNLNGGSGGALGFRNMNASWGVAFDFCVDRAENLTYPPCLVRETRMHYVNVPTSMNNATNATVKKRASLYMPNTLNDGFQHQVMVRYFGQRPPWIEVYIDDSLFLQERGIDLEQVLDAHQAWVGFTSATGSSAQESVDLLITDLQVTAVAIADQNTRPYMPPNATLSAVADGRHPLSFSVQNFDLCGNVITFGGYPERAYAYLKSNVPSAAPTTSQPTVSPHRHPTAAPTPPTTMSPTFRPTLKPTLSPTPKVTRSPTSRPVLAPSKSPTAQPSHVGRRLVDASHVTGVAEIEAHVHDDDGGDGGGGGRRLVTSTVASSNYSFVGSVVDNNDGTYSFVFNTTESGTYDLHMYFGLGCFTNNNVSLGLADSVDPNVCFYSVDYAVAEFFPTTPAPTYADNTNAQPLSSAALAGVGVAAGVISAVGCMLIVFGVRVRNRWRRDKEFIEAGRIAAAERGVEYLGDSELDRLQNQLQRTLEDIQKERSRKAAPDDQSDAIRALLKQKGELQETVRRLKIRAQGGDPNAPVVAEGAFGRVRKSFAASSRIRQASSSTSEQRQSMGMSLFRSAAPTSTEVSAFQADNPAYNPSVRSSISKMFRSNLNRPGRAPGPSFQEVPPEPEI